MNFRLSLVLFFLLAFVAIAKTPVKSFIVTYPKNTKPSVVEAAKEKIIKNGGKITHSYGESVSCCLPASH